MRRLWVAILIPLLVAGGVAANEYVLGPGDIIDIAVFGQPDLSKTIAIGPDGMITLPLVGMLKAAGLTTSQLEQAITEKLRAYVRTPRVTITVREFRVEQAYILGQVARPGAYPIRAGQGLVELIAAAGGLTPIADIKAITLTRDGKQTLVNLEPVVAAVSTQTTQAAQAQAQAPGGPPVVDRAINIPLRGGDVVMVPEGNTRVSVLGFVNVPGAFELKPGDNVVSLIARAGGPNLRGTLKGVGIIRPGKDKPEIIKVDVDAALRSGDTSKLPTLQAGDIIYVPETSAPDWTRILQILQVLRIFLLFL